MGTVRARSNVCPVIGCLTLAVFRSPDCAVRISTSATDASRYGTRSSTSASTRSGKDRRAKPAGARSFSRTRSSQPCARCWPNRTARRRSSGETTMATVSSSAKRGCAGCYNRGCSMLTTQTVTRALFRLGLDRRRTDAHRSQPVPMLLQKADATRLFCNTPFIVGKPT